MCIVKAESDLLKRFIERVNRFVFNSCRVRARKQGSHQSFVLAKVDMSILE